MNVLKSAVFAACVIGVISSIAGIATPNGHAKRQLRLITSLVLILSVVTPFLGKGFDIDLEGLKKLTDTKLYSELNGEFEDMYQSMTNEQLSREIERQITAEGIDVKKVVIQNAGGEYNSIEAVKVTVSADEMNDERAQRINRIVKEALPDAEVEITEETSREHQHD